MIKTMNNKLTKKELKRNVITVFDTLIFIVMLVYSSCSNTAQQDISLSEIPDVITQDPEQNQEKGVATVRMFIPDYYALAEQYADRAIAPQTKTVRLSYRINDSWIGINSIDLSTASKTSVENAPEGFPGSVYTFTFSGVPVGTYNINDLKIELLDITGNTITSGTNTTSVTITKGGSASTTFYTIPVSNEPSVGNLAAGEMKFSLEYLYTDIKYKVSMKTSGDYPDIVLFSNDGKIMNYYVIDSAEDEVQIEVPVSGQYYIGVWADDGNKIGRYEYSLGKIEFITKQLYGGIHYSIDLISSGSYPDVVLFKEGELIHYYTISNEEEAHITLTVQDSGSYTFVIYGNETDNYNLMIDDLKLYDANLVQGINYDIKITTTEDYPDLALIKFSSYGAEGELLDYQLVNYWSIADEEGCSRSISVDESGLYAFALIGMKLDKYSLQFDLSKGTQLQGVLTGDKLTWTKAKSPYIVKGNLLVESGSELSIEPGVIVQFTGRYYIRIDGSINAIGSNNEPIIFARTGDNLNSWSGITINGDSNLLTENNEYKAGNILRNCMFVGASYPLYLNTSVYIDSCSFTGNGGYIYARNNSFIRNCTIENGLYLENFYGTVTKNNIHGCVTIGQFNGNIINNVIYNGITCNCEYWDLYGTIINNAINGNIEMGGNTTFKNNTFSAACIYLYEFSGLFTSNIINNCPLSLYSIGGKFTGNNFLNYNGIIFDASRSGSGIYDFTGNYWGESQTSELNELGNKANISFLNDYYDNFEWTKIDYSNWATEPIEGVGYLGDGFIAFDYTINGYNYENGGYYPESTSPELSIAITSQYHANDISSVRVAQSLAALKTADWSSYNSSQSFTVDKTKLSDGLATIYVQLKDSEGYISSPVMHKVPFDNPVVTLSITDGSTYSTATSSIILNYGATDKGNLIQYELYLDGQIISREESYNEDWGNYGWGSSYSNSYTLGLAYMAAGEHTIKATFWDYARNSTTKTVTFTINRNVNTNAFSSGFDSTTGQLLKDSKTIYLWHFDENGNEAGNNSSANIGSYNLGTGSLGGYASYAYTSGSIDVPLESAFTIEYWHKGNDYIQICKGNVFNCYFTELGFTNYCSYYKNSSGSISDNIFSCYPISDDNWHFYTFVQSKSYVAVYCDGVLFNYTAGLSDTLNTNDNKLYINANNIDELRISNVARSPDEIVAYYNAAKSHIVSE